jgi:ankyrin repeat protein
VWDASATVQNGQVAPTFVDACKTGSLEEAQWLAESTPLRPQDVRSSNNLALRATCENGRLEVVQWLIDEFALTRDDASECAKDGRSALSCACVNAHFDVAKTLMESFCFSPEAAIAALHAACSNGQLEMCKWLVKECRIVQKKNSDMTRVVLSNVLLRSPVNI